MVEPNREVKPQMLRRFFLDRRDIEAQLCMALNAIPANTSFAWGTDYTVVITEVIHTTGESAK